MAVYSRKLSRESLGLPRSFLSALAEAARLRGSKTIRFLADGDADGRVESITYEELWTQARSVAARLRERVPEGSRAVLACPPGVGFIIDFFACQCAGVVPVPVSLPNRRRGMKILSSISADCDAKLVLSTGAAAAQLSGDPALANVPVVDTAALDRTAPMAPGDIRLAELALLQYTSGSTGQPRGVMVTQSNLVSNHREMSRGFGHDRRTIIVSWLPMFHDMGLGMLFSAVWLGLDLVLLPPRSMIQSPFRWLKAISDFRGSSSGGPDFGFELCTQRVTEEELKQLDLTCWKTAFNGSEPVRAKTLERFVAKFEKCGFSRDAYHPAYGLAEVTLFVTAGSPKKPPEVEAFDAEGLEAGLARVADSGQERRLVSCGATWLDTRLAIVDPETSTVCPEGRIGEIWIHGSSVTAGYWQRPEETEQTFRARLASGEGPFLRTGDLAFQHEGRLFITGRLKDLIIIRGRNHYPSDIEATVGASHPALSTQAGAAFSIDTDSGERLVVVHELERTALRSAVPSEVLRAIRSAISEEHGLQVYAIALLRPATILRTTSGKIQRRACKKAFLNNELRTVMSWATASGPQEDAPDAPDSTRDRAGQRALAWLRENSGPLAAECAGNSSPGGAYLGGLAGNQNRFRRSAGFASREPGGRRPSEGGPRDGLRIPRSVVWQLATQGLWALHVSEEYGGLGLCEAEAARALEQLAAIDVGLGVHVAIANSMGSRPIARHAAVGTRRALLPALSSGGGVAAFALQCSDGSVDSSAGAVWSEAHPLGRRLMGSASWRSFGLDALALNVAVRGAGSEGSTAYCIQAKPAGLKESHEVLPGSMTRLCQHTVRLDDVIVADSDRLGDVGQGAAIAGECVDHLRLSLGAVCLGGLKRIVQVAVDYAHGASTPDGKPLMNSPVTLARIGPVTAAIEALQCLVETLTARVDAGASVPSEVIAACRIAGPELLWKAADDLFHFIGSEDDWSRQCLVSRTYSDARMLRSFEGTTESVAARVGDVVLRDSHRVRSFLSDSLGLPRMAAVLDQAVEAVRVRGRQFPASSGVDCDHWSNRRAGELVSWIVLWAVAEAESARNPKPALARAMAWARASFERAMASVQGGTPSEAVALGPSAITEAVGAYASGIGDLAALRTGRRSIVRPGPSVFPHDASADELREWIVSWLSRHLRLEERQVDPDRSFADHGIDSLAAVQLAKGLSDKIGFVLDETVLWNFATIGELVDYLADRAGEPQSQQPSSVEAQATDRGETAAGGPDSTIDDEIDSLERELLRRS